MHENGSHNINFSNVCGATLMDLVSILVVGSLLEIIKERSLENNGAVVVYCFLLVLYALHF